MSPNFLILWPLSFPLLPFAPNTLKLPSPPKDFIDCPVIKFFRTGSKYADIFIKKFWNCISAWKMKYLNFECLSRTNSVYEPWRLRDSNSVHDQQLVLLWIFPPYSSAVFVVWIFSVIIWFQILEMSVFCSSLKTSLFLKINFT